MLPHGLFVSASFSTSFSFVDAAEIPEYVFESLARSLLLVIQKYYESEDGKKAFAEWKAKKEISYSAST